MIPNWKIGPVARRRLAEMAKGGWADHTIRHFPVETDRWYVEVYNIEDGTVSGNSFEAFGNTIGLAVADAWSQWKRWKKETDRE